MTRLMAASLFVALVGTGAAVKAQEVRPKNEDRGQVESSLAARNRAARQRYLDSLTEEQRRYKGLVVAPNPKAKGAELAVQKHIAAELSAHDFVPADRDKQFRWITTEAGYKITGWVGTVIRTTKSPDGLIIEVRVIPRHDEFGGFRTSDYALETYPFTPNGFTLIGSRRGEKFGGIKTFN